MRIALVTGLVLVACVADAQQAPPTPPAAPTSASGRPSHRVTMQELHNLGGIPRGWTFTLPPGDASRGRQVFRDLECYKCHTVKTENFPPPSTATGSAGLDLTGMGRVHPAEYFAESILDPNAVIVEGPGHTGLDGLSIMPSFVDSLTVRQLLDLVAYLRSQTPFQLMSNEPREFRGQGVVRATLPDLGVLVIAHDPIPGYMPAMTMGFRAQPAIYHAVQVGDTVSFVLRVAPLDVSVTSIQKVIP